MFGVAPGTGPSTNPVATDAVKSNTIFTNVAETEDGDVWWEGLTKEPPAKLKSWLGMEWTRDKADSLPRPDQANSRFAVNSGNVATMDEAWESPDGVPIDAILFGGRRPTTVPLCWEARDWAQGVFMGATMASQKTAAQENADGSLRRDPFAMLPFCGYNMGDYFQTWLDFANRQPNAKVPKIFMVNWFRLDREDKKTFLWPGFGQNTRVLKHIWKRTEDDTGEMEGCVDTCIGKVATVESLGVPEGYTKEQIGQALDVDGTEWRDELRSIAGHLSHFGRRMPDGLWKEWEKMYKDVGGAL